MQKQKEFKEAKSKLFESSLRKSTVGKTTEQVNVEMNESLRLKHEAEIRGIVDNNGNK